MSSSIFEYCQVFTSSGLNVGEICYRFCEDGSQNTIDRRDGCPSGTECGGTVPSTSIVSFVKLVKWMITDASINR